MDLSSPMWTSRGQRWWSCQDQAPDWEMHWQDSWDPNPHPALTPTPILTWTQGWQCHCCLRQRRWWQEGWRCGWRRISMFHPIHVFASTDMRLCQGLDQSRGVPGSRGSLGVRRGPTRAWRHRGLRQGQEGCHRHWTLDRSGPVLKGGLLGAPGQHSPDWVQGPSTGRGSRGPRWWTQGMLRSQRSSLAAWLAVSNPEHNTTSDSRESRGSLQSGEIAAGSPDPGSPGPWWSSLEEQRKDPREKENEEEVEERERKVSVTEARNGKVSSVEDSGCPGGSELNIPGGLQEPPNLEWPDQPVDLPPRGRPQVLL